MYTTPIRHPYIPRPYHPKEPWEGIKPWPSHPSVPYQPGEPNDPVKREIEKSKYKDKPDYRFKEAYKCDKFVVHVEVPGFKSSDINVYVQGGNLHIEAKLPSDVYGVFRSRFNHKTRLPKDVDVNGECKANLELGILTVVLPLTLNSVDRKEINVNS